MSAGRQPLRGPEPLRKWLCHKSLSLSEYLKSYAETAKDTCYLELFATPASNPCPGTSCPANVASPPVVRASAVFDCYIFLTPNADVSKELTHQIEPLGRKASVLEGSITSESLLKTVFDLLPRSLSCLAILDPPGFHHCRWSLLARLAAHGQDWQGHRPELLIFFPLEMALARNLTRPDCAASLTRFFGNKEWMETAHRFQEKEIDLDGVKRELVALFVRGLRGLGYKYVTDFAPARSRGPAFYHIIRASDRESQGKLVAAVFGQQRYLPCELFGNDQGVHSSCYYY